MNPPVSIKRNQPCHCKSGRKYKQCCLEKDRRKAADLLGSKNVIEAILAGSAVKRLARRRLVS